MKTNPGRWIKTACSRVKIRETLRGLRLLRDAYSNRWIGSKKSIAWERSEHSTYILLSVTGEVLHLLMERLTDDRFACRAGLTRSELGQLAHTLADWHLRIEEARNVDAALLSTPEVAP